MTTHAIIIVSNSTSFTPTASINRTAYMIFSATLMEIESSFIRGVSGDQSVLAYEYHQRIYHQT